MILRGRIGELKGVEGLEEVFARVYIIYGVVGAALLFIFGHLEGHDAAGAGGRDAVAGRDAPETEVGGRGDEYADVGLILKTALKEEGTLHHYGLGAKGFVLSAEGLPLLGHAGPHKAVETLGLLGACAEKAAKVVALEAADEFRYLLPQRLVGGH